jgi:adenylate kinase
MRLIFLGPPGSGKGTQADRVCRDMGLTHLSTGDMLREEVRNDTELGREVRSIMEAGDLVGDAIVNSLVFRRIEKLDRFLLDGYPRNLGQARELDAFAEKVGRGITGVVLLDVPDDEVVRRISGRVTCPECGYVGSVEEHPPGQPCPECGTALVQREDDRPEAVRKRLENYHALTSPLVRHYSDQLVRVNGVGAVDDVTRRIEGALRRMDGGGD